MKRFWTGLLAMLLSFALLTGAVAEDIDGQSALVAAETAMEQQLPSTEPSTLQPEEAAVEEVELELLPEGVTADGAPVAEAPVDGTPVEQAQAADMPVDDAPAEDAPVEDAREAGEGTCEDVAENLDAGDETVTEAPEAMTDAPAEAAGEIGETPEEIDAPVAELDELELTDVLKAAEAGLPGEAVDVPDAPEAEVEVYRTWSALASDATAEDGEALLEGYMKLRLGDLPALSAFVKRNRAMANAAYEQLCLDESLSGTAALYNLVKPMLQAVADGEATSTLFTFSPEALGIDGHEWTAEALGLESLEDESLGDALMAREGIDTRALLNALLADCPYELYWYDKTVGMGTGFGYSLSTLGDEIVSASLGTITLSFAVAQDYSAGENQVNDRPRQIGAATANIRGIIDANASSGDVDKLYAYADAICGLVNYNHPRRMMTQRPTAIPGSWSTCSTATTTRWWSARAIPRRSNICAT